MKNKVTKILVLLLILGLIIIKVCNVEASSLEDLLNSTGNEITAENGSTSGLPQNNDVVNNPVTNQPTVNTPSTTTTNNPSNNGTSLPKTGANENIIIGLMIVCTLTGVYAFKKVKDYNM